MAGGLNTYGYAYQNPLSYTDPTGLIVPAVVGSVAMFCAKNPAACATGSYALCRLVGGCELPNEPHRNESADESKQCDDYPENPDDWTPPEGWTETDTGERTGGKHRQWKDGNGETTRRWDREGREGGRQRGPHWHDVNHPNGIGHHIDPNR